jgi:hypothetical protein
MAVVDPLATPGTFQQSGALELGHELTNDQPGSCPFLEFASVGSVMRSRSADHCRQAFDDGKKVPDQSIGRDEKP